MSKNILSWLLACWLLMPLCPLFSQAADPQAAAHQTLLDLYRRSLSFSRLSPDSSRLYQERARNHQQRELPDCASCRARLNFLTTHRAYFQEQMETVITQGTIQAEAALRDSVVDWAVEELIYVAYAYQNTGRLARAGETHYRTLALMDESGVDHRRSDVLRALSELYRKQRNYEQCLSFAQRSVDLAQAQADTVASYHSINELANVYSTFDQLDSALYYYSQLIDTLKFHPVRPFDQMRTHLNLGRLYSLSSDYPRAEYHLREALVIYEREGWQSVGRLAHTLNELMTLYRRWGAYRSALRYGERLLPLVDSLSDVHLARNIFRQYRKVLVGLEDFEGAYRAGQRFQVLQDSIHRREERGIILDLEARYQNQAKQDRIALLEKDHQLNRLRWRGLLLAVLLGVVLLLLGFGFWINRQRRVRERLRLKAAQLQEMDALKTAFYTNVTHELRTPLTLILSPLEALLQEQYGPLAPAVRKIIRLTKRNAERLLRLSNDILDLSKLEARQLALVESAVDLPALVQRCCAHFETTARLREIDLRWVLPAADWPPLRLDRQKVEAILHNLLSNALKFTSRGETIRVLLEGGAGRIGLRVVDTGRGIAPEDVPHVFDRFFQSHQPEAVHTGGTGIGLALAHEFAQLMGGQLRVGSRLGEGSEFQLDLPWVAAAFHDPLPPPAPALQESLPLAALTAEGGRGSGPRLLLVEDQADMQHYLVSLLEPHYTLQLCFNGREAWDYLQRQAPPALILSDVMMPEMDGFELLRRLKQNESLALIPTIFLTARTHEADRLNALRVGIDDYLTKPFSHEELLVRIDRLLQRRTERLAPPVVETAMAEGAEETTAVQLRPRVKLGQQWLQRVESILLREIKNKGYHLNDLASELHVSPSKLARQIKSLTGLTPNKYFLEIRLYKAKQHLEAADFQTVAEVSYSIGFEDPHYFSGLYQGRFGKRPSTYFR